MHKLCMHKVPIFSSLDQSELEKIASIIIHKEYKRGERLYSEGDAPNSLIILNEGSVKAYKYTPEGREQILYVFSEGDFLGEQYLFGSKTATYSVEALESVKTCSIAREDIKHILLSYPEIAVKVIEELGARMGRLESTLQSIGIRSVDSRVASLILDFAEKYGTVTSDGILIRLPLSREGIANYLGIARETISRKLGQLESENIIRSVSNKAILVLDKSTLESLSGNTMQ